MNQYLQYLLLYAGTLTSLVLTVWFVGGVVFIVMSLRKHKK